MRAVAAEEAAAAEAKRQEELNALKAQNTQQAVQIATLTETGRKCEEKHTAKDAELKKCEEKHQTTELKITEIQAAIAELKGK